MIKKFLTYSPLGIIFMFLIVKFSSFSYNFSDTFGYYLAGQYILNSKLLYKDIFMTNLPFFSYISAFYAFFIRDNLPLYVRMSSIEAALCGYMLWLIIRKEMKSVYMQCLLIATYLFSALVLISTEFQMGILLATLFAVSSYYFYRKESFVLSGIAIALAVCTKGYLIAVPASMLLYDVYVRRWKSWNFIGPYFATILIVLAPSILLVPNDFIRNISFTVGRPDNPGRWYLHWHIIMENWLFFIFLGATLINFRKNPLLAIMAGASYGFLVYFQDVYYYYFNVALPFMLLGAVELYKILVKKIPKEIVVCGFSALCIASMMMHLQAYGSNQMVRRFENPEKLVHLIKQAKPDVLYGNADITAVVSLKSGIPLMNGVIDLNPKIFEKGLYSANQFTADIFKQKTIVLLYGIHFNGEDIYTIDGENSLDLIAKIQVIQAKCKRIYTQPIYSADILNRFFVMQCY